MDQPDPTPQLQPPGAGLPAVELFLGRIGFRIMGLMVSRAAASRWFRTEADRVLALARSLGEAAASRRVLVPKLLGLEDSSRYWSVYMTLDHLCIVQSGITGVMVSLAAGRAIDRVVSTADVKPSPTADAATITRFEAVAQEHDARTEALTGWDSKLSLKHPWFGSLKVPQWHRMAAFHLRIHRKQIERIIGLLPREANTV